MGPPDARAGRRVGAAPEFQCKSKGVDGAGVKLGGGCSSPAVHPRSRLFIAPILKLNLSPTFTSVARLELRLPCPKAASVHRGTGTTEVITRPSGGLAVSVCFRGCNLVHIDGVNNDKLCLRRESSPSQAT